MDIIWGDFEIHLEKTVALILALTPLIAVTMIPRVAEMIKRFVYMLKERKRKQHPGLYS